MGSRPKRSRPRRQLSRPRRGRDVRAEHRDKTMDRSRDCLGTYPWYVCAHDACRFSTCCVIENFRIIVTPRALIDSTCAIFAIASTGNTTARQLCWEWQVWGGIDRISWTRLISSWEGFCVSNLDPIWYISNFFQITTLGNINIPFAQAMLSLNK